VYFRSVFVWCVLYTYANIEVRSMSSYCY